MRTVRSVIVALAIVAMGRGTLDSAARARARVLGTGPTLVLASGDNYQPILPEMGAHSGHSAGRITDQGTVNLYVTSTLGQSNAEPVPFTPNATTTDYNGVFLGMTGGSFQVQAIQKDGVQVDVGGGNVLGGLLAINQSVDSTYTDHVDDGGGETVFEARFYTPSEVQGSTDQYSGIFSYSGGKYKLRVLHQSNLTLQNFPFSGGSIGPVYGASNGVSISFLQLNSSRGYAVNVTDFSLSPQNDRIVVNDTSLQGLPAGSTLAMKFNDQGNVASIRGEGDPSNGVPVKRVVYLNTNPLFAEGDTLPGVGLIQSIYTDSRPLTGDITMNGVGDLAVAAAVFPPGSTVPQDIVLVRSAAGQFLPISFAPGSSMRVGGFWSLSNLQQLVVRGGVQGLGGDGEPGFQVLSLDFANKVASVISKYFMADLFPQNSGQQAPYFASINANGVIAFSFQPPDNNDATYTIGLRQQVYLGIDSFNQYGYDDPVRSPGTDAVKNGGNDPSTGAPLPGKLIAVNILDKNFNSVPDFADGYGQGLDSTIDDSRNIYERFVPVKLALPRPVSFDDARLQFDYSFSDPAQVTLTGGTYVLPPTGWFRLWNAPGDQPRSMQSVKDFGNLIPPGSTYSPRELGFTSEDQTLTLYLEAVGDPPGSPIPLHITVHCDDGLGDPLQTDGVLVSVVDCPPGRPLPKTPSADVQDDNGWKFKYTISLQDGLTFGNVFLQGRKMADQMSVAPVVVKLPQTQQPYYIPLVVNSGNTNPRCQLADFRDLTDGTTRVFVASYVIDQFPEGPGRCLLVTERYQFHKLDPNEDVEPSAAAPFPFNLASLIKRPLRAARFKPIVSYAYHGPANEAPDSVEIPQYHHFTPDNSFANNAVFIHDDDALQFSLSVIPPAPPPEWLPFPNPLNLPPVSWVKRPFDVYRKQNPLQSEAVVNAIVGSAAGEMDNMHYTNQPDVDLPFPPPGCPECIHIHWRWGAFLKFPDGIPLVPRDKLSRPRHQSVDVGLVKFHAGEDHPVGVDWRTYAGTEALTNSDLVFWYAGFVNPTGVTDPKERMANGFFTHGGFFAPSVPGKPKVKPPGKGKPGSPLSFQASFTPTDPAAAYQVFWSFGDGSTMDWQPVADPSSMTASHTYSLASDYMVQVFVINPDGIIDSDYAVFTVGADTPPPLANAGPDQTVEQTSLAGASVTLDGSGSSDPGGNSLTYTWTGPFGTASGPTPTVTMPLGKYVVTLTVDNGQGGQASATVNVTVKDTTPPVLVNVPPGVVVEQSGLAGASVSLTPPTATDICDAAPSVSSNAPAIFPLGTTIVTWTATDASGNKTTATTTVKVVDTSPPAFTTLSVSPSVIAAEHHGTVSVVVTAIASDVCDAAPVSRITAISSNQKDTGSPDAVITGLLSADLSAANHGKTARVYTISVQCADASGNVTTGVVTVTVPPLTHGNGP